MITSFQYCLILLLFMHQNHIRITLNLTILLVLFPISKYISHWSIWRVPRTKIPKLYQWSHSNTPTNKNPKHKVQNASKTTTVEFGKREILTQKINSELNGNKREQGNTLDKWWLKWILAKRRKGDKVLVGVNKKWEQEFWEPLVHQGSRFYHDIWSITAVDGICCLFCYYPIPRESYYVYGLHSDAVTQSMIKFSENDVVVRENRTQICNF